MMSFLLKLLRWWGRNPGDCAVNPRKSDDSVYPRLYESRLESRRVLNAAPLPFPTEVSELLIDAGENRNDGVTDTFEIRQASSGSSGELQILVNAQKVWEGAYDQLEKIRIEGSSDRDVVKIDAELNWQGKIQFSGGANDEGGEDSLQILSSPNRLWEQIQTRLESNAWSRTYYAAPDSRGLLIETSGVESMLDLSRSTAQTYDILNTSGGWGLASLAKESTAGWGGNEAQVLSGGNRSWTFADGSAMQIRFFEPASSASLEISDLRTNARSLDIRGSSILVHGQVTTSPGANVTLDAGWGHSVFVSGTIDVSGRSLGDGGQIVLLGERVELQDGARLNATSDLNGGKIWIGGGKQGTLLGDTNSQSVKVSASAVVEADSIQNGNGGAIVIWSETNTVIEGTGNLRARGGLLGGNGGFIETSSRGALQVDNPAVLTASAGRGGLWLVDPSSIVIVSTPTANTATVTYVLASTIESQLNNGVSVSYITSTGSGDGDILVQAAINVTGTNNATLSLNATRDIQFSASGNIAGNQVLSLQLTAGRNIQTDSATLSALRELNLSATSGDIALGAVAIGNGSGLPGFAMTSVSRSLATTGLLSSLGGDIQLRATDTNGTSISLDDVSTGAGDLEIQAASVVAFVGGAGSIQSTSGQLRIRGLQTTTALGFGTGASGDLRMNDASLLAIASGFTGWIQYGQSLQTGKITLDGSSHTYADALTIVASGGADVVINSSLTVQGAGNSLVIQGSNASEVELAGDLQTSGGSISIVADRLLVDGGSMRTIESSGGGSTTGGEINLGSVVRIDGKGGAANLLVRSQATDVGGNIAMGNVVKDNDGSGLNRLSIQSSGSVSDGVVTIGSVRLVGKSGTPALFQINQSDSTATDIIASGVIDLRDGTLGQQAGSIDFGSSRLTPLLGSSTLELRTQHTGLGVVDNGSDGGDIRIGGVGNRGSLYFDSLLIDMRGAGLLNESGTLSVTGTGDRVLGVDGSNGGSASTVGIEILGTVELAAANPLSIQTNPGGVAGLSSRAIDLRSASFTGSGSLSLVTGSTVVGNSSNVAGNVFLADVDLSTAGSSLSIDTRGTTMGRTRLDHATGSTVTVTVHGDLDFRNTLTELVDSATLRVLGDTNELKLGNVEATGSQGLNLLSEGSISVGSIDLNTGLLSIQLDTDNDSVSELTATGTLDAGSITITGSALGNDTVWLGGDVTTGVGAIQFEDLSSVQLASDTDLRSATNIIMVGEVGVLELVGASGTNILQVQGNNTALETSSISGTGNVTLELRSDHSILLGNVLLTNGMVEASIGRSTARTDTVFRAGSVQARGLRVTGGGPANDEVHFTDQLDLGVDGLLVEEVKAVFVQSNIESVGTVELRDVTGEVQFQNPLTVRGAGILARTGVGFVRLLGNGSAYQFISTGDANDLELADVGSSDSVSLSLSSEGGMQLGAVTLVPASQLSVQVDSDADSVGASFSSQSLQAGTLSLRGSVQRNDDALIAGALTSSTGSVIVENWRVFEIQGNVSSATQTAFSRISDDLRLGATTQVIANAGDLLLHEDVARITLATSVTPVQFVSIGGSARLAAMQSGGLSREVEVNADRDVILQGTDLAKRLTVRSAQDGLGIGRVESTGTVRATEVRFFAANGIGSVTPIQVQTNRMEAKNSHSGDIRLANSVSGLAVWDVEGLSGTNIHVSQTGGTMSLERILTSADGTPSVGESNALVQSQNSDVIVAGTGIQIGGLGSLSFLGSGTGNVDFQRDVVVGQGALQVVSGGMILGSGTLQSSSIEFVAGSGVGGGGPIRTKTSMLRAFSQLGDVQVLNESVSPLSVHRLQSNGFGSVSLEQSGGGSLVVFQASTASGSGDITLVNPLGSVSLAGNILASGNGDIELIAGGDIQMLAGSLARTSSETGIFRAESGGRFELQNGAVIHVGASNSQTEALLNRIPTELAITPIANPDGINVDAVGSASLIVRIGAANPFTIDKNFGIMIDWADGEVDNVPLGARSPLSTYPAVSRFDATGIPFLIQHQYLGNPNVNDPAASIPIVFTLTTDPFQRIRISDQFGTGNLLTQVVQVDLTVPAAGLFALRIELPQVQITSRALVLASEVILQTNSLVAASSTVAELPSSVSDVVTKAERQYVLRLVTPRNEAGEVIESDNIELSESDISDLPGLFRRLGDNRYRIYAILDGGIELLLRDFYLKKHLPFELEEATANEVPIPGLVQPEGEPESDLLDAPRNESREGETQELDPASSTRSGSELEEVGSEGSVGNEGLASGILSVLLPQQSFRRAARRLRKQVASRPQQPSNSLGAK